MFHLFHIFLPLQQMMAVFLQLTVLFITLVLINHTKIIIFIEQDQKTHGKNHHHYSLNQNIKKQDIQNKVKPTIFCYLLTENPV